MRNGATHSCIKFLVVACTLTLVTCTPLISPFDQYAYAQTTSLKVDAMDLMDQATDDYATHLQQIKTVQSNLQKIYEYDRNRPKSTLITAIWQKIMDTSGHLLGGFISRWKKEGHLTNTFIDDEKKSNIGPAFDQIAELESRLNKPQGSNN